MFSFPAIKELVFRMGALHSTLSLYMPSALHPPSPFRAMEDTPAGG